MTLSLTSLTCIRRETKEKSSEGYESEKSSS